MEMEERAVRVEQVFRPPPTPPPWSKYFSSTPGVFCVLFDIQATEKSGMPNAQIAIGLKEKNSRSREKAI
jgi:hypothetical protein